MATRPDDFEFNTSVTRSQGAAAVDRPPLIDAVERAHHLADDLESAIDSHYKRLDHLIIHRPEPENSDKISLAREAHSDTVSRVETLGDRLESLHERLLRLHRILEA